MTTRTPDRETVVTLLEQVRAEPEGPDRASAIEVLEAQLAALDDPANREEPWPDADLFEAVAAPEEPAVPTGEPAPPAEEESPAKPVGKPF